MHDLAVRATNKYVGTFSHLDDWNSIGSFDVISSDAKSLDEEDPCDPTSITLTLKVESDATEDDIRKALHGSLSKHGCHHEHDCCGCVSTSVESATCNEVGTWIVVQSASRNY